MVLVTFSAKVSFRKKDSFILNDTIIQFLTNDTKCLNAYKICFNH